MATTSSLGEEGGGQGGRVACQLMQVQYSQQRFLEHEAGLPRVWKAQQGSLALAPESRRPPCKPCPRPATHPCQATHLWIQLHHCRPEPSGPPAKMEKTGIMRPSAPPSLASTMPVRSTTTRVWASAAAASHARHTSAR
jgi:hypothetical protein